MREDPENKIDTNEALRIVEEKYKKIALPTLIKWCAEQGVGHKIGGRWAVYKDKLIELLEKGNNEKKETNES